MPPPSRCRRRTVDGGGLDMNVTPKVHSRKWRTQPAFLFSAVWHIHNHVGTAARRRRRTTARLPSLTVLVPVQRQPEHCSGTHFNRDGPLTVVHACQMS